MVKILVCGGRMYGEETNEDIFGLKQKSFENYDTLYSSLDVYLAPDYHPLTIIHGAARGADSMTSEWAAEREIKQEVYPAQWDKYGKSAGYIRNKQMLDEGKPDIVVAFPGGKGTEMMKQIARNAGVKVIEIG